MVGRVHHHHHHRRRRRRCGRRWRRPRQRQRGMQDKFSWIRRFKSRACLSVLLRAPIVASFMAERLSPSFFRSSCSCIYLTGGLCRGGKYFADERNAQIWQNKALRNRPGTQPQRGAYNNKKPTASRPLNQKRTPKLKRVIMNTF